MNSNESLGTCANAAHKHTHHTDRLFEAMNKETAVRMIETKALPAICLCVLCGILVAGLWPFHAPKNEVSWLTNHNGLLFGDYGSILSAGEFKSADSWDDGPCSLEIWSQPAATFDSNDIVAFSAQQNPVQFAVAQSGDDLFVLRDIPDEQHHLKTAHIAVDHVFHRGKELLVTITSTVQGTVVYINGTQVKTFPQFRIKRRDFTGQLVIANSPVQTNTWSGQLWGLGIYNNELTPAQVLQHYRSWVKNNGNGLEGGEGALALYLFDEHSGRVVHNAVAPGPSLFIPEHYFVLQPHFLTPPWKEFQNSWTYWENVILNIAAFIPLGLFYSAYCSSIRQIKRATAAAIVLGFAVSFTIEILQAFLPTRDSGMTDLITNGSGTALGAGLYAWLTKHPLVGRVGISIQSAAAEKKTALLR
jgi:hypothetical protein